MGHVWLSAESITGNADLIAQGLKEIHLPAMEFNFDTQAPGERITSDQVETGFFGMDGDAAGIAAMTQDKDIQAWLKRIAVVVFKHHRSLSLLFQCNDTWNGHMKVHKYVRSGKLKGMLTAPSAPPSGGAGQGSN